MKIRTLQEAETLDSVDGPLPVESTAPVESAPAREQEGKPTAVELVAADKAAPGKAPYGWFWFCTSADYCTRPCAECRHEAELSAAADELRKGARP